MNSELGLVHIYCGDGKGKTTAAIGLSLRAIGNGLNVVVLQFLKNGQSGEIAMLKPFPGAVVMANDTLTKFSFCMNEQEKIDCKRIHEDIFSAAVKLCNNGSCDVLVLDEIIGTIGANLFDESILVDFLINRPKNIEVIMTGRNPSDTLVELADYLSEIKCIKHPYEKGVSARKGIEM